MVKYEAKKLAKAQAKKSAENLVKNELKTNSYGKLTDLNQAIKKQQGKMLKMMRIIYHQKSL